MNEMVTIILQDFAMWIKSQPVYIGGIAGKKEVLVLRDGELKSAVEVYLNENKLIFKIAGIDNALKEEDCNESSKM